MVAAGVTFIGLFTAVSALTDTLGTRILERSTNTGIRYMSGGVGLEERTAMENAASGYNLELVFSIAAGNYLSRVDVMIEDADGKVILSEQANGPWFFVDLPKGSYEVSAIENGTKRSRNVQVGGARQRVLFHWKV